MNVCQFNTSSIPTLFASSCAESLLVTNNLSGSIPLDYPVLSIDDPNNVLYETNLGLIGKCAADAASLQCLAMSLHRTTQDDETMNFSDFVESKRKEAALEAINVSYKPVNIDDFRFSLSNVPFSFLPPPDCSLLNKKGDSARLDESNQALTSDWPSDLCSLKPRYYIFYYSMLPVSWSCAKCGLI